MILEHTNARTTEPRACTTWPISGNSGVDRAKNPERLRLLYLKG